MFDQSPSNAPVRSHPINFENLLFLEASEEIGGISWKRFATLNFDYPTEGDFFVICHTRSELTTEGRRIDQWSYQGHLSLPKTRHLD